MLLQIFVFLCIASITLSTPDERFENTDDRSNSDIMQKNDEADQLDVLRGIAKRDEYDMIEPTYELDEDEAIVMRGVATFNEDDMIKRASEPDGEDLGVEKRLYEMRGTEELNGSDMTNAKTEHDSPDRDRRVAKRIDRERKRNDIMVRTPPPSPDRGGATY